MPKTKDVDYLFLSSRVRALESALADRERLEQMLDAPTVEDAYRVLSECGWSELAAVTPQTVEEALGKEREKVFSDLASSAPDPDILSVFQIKYDYHNVKVLLKSQALGLSPDPLLMGSGRLSPAVLQDALSQEGAPGLPPILRAAALEAKKVLEDTGDSQQMDFLLDRAYFADLSDLARRSESPFLEGYVRLSIDASNLRALVRAHRMGKGSEFLEKVLFPGGNVDLQRLLDAVRAGSSPEELFTDPLLRPAAEAGQAAANGGRLTRFEKLCDDALTAYLDKARFVPFGEAPLIGYLAEKETELTNVRVLFSGRFAGLDTDIIRERMREYHG